MTLYIRVIAGPDDGNVIQLQEGETILVGRSRAAQTRLLDPYISRVHCQLQVDGGQVILTDFDSAGGTFVNGNRITTYNLKLGDIISLGRTQMRLQDSEDEEPPSTMEPPAPGVAPARPMPFTWEDVAKLSGQTLSHFQVGQVLARGQTGYVFHARDTRSDVPMALKVLGPEFSTDEEQRERFLRAMRTVLPLRHLNLVTVYAAGKSGLYNWIAMEYIEGDSLTQVIQRASTAGQLDWHLAVRVGIHISRALDYAHQQHIIHRDVTPMNIMIRAGDKLAKLGDLMLAKALEGVLTQRITQPGRVLGDVRYLSPEGAESTGKLDDRSDLYSLGATLYHLSTGRPPFEASTLAETLALILHADLVSPRTYQPALPPFLETVLLKLLARNPEQRFPSAAALRAELEQLAIAHGVVF